jgi:hypothetical protein
MAKKPAEQTAWDVKLSAEKRENFTQWLCDEITNAEAARSVPISEVQYWWRLYEQARTRGDNQPWQDAADLTSYFGTEKADALKSRIMRTLMVDPVWTVEGWGQSAKKAPFVEDFHQWQLELEGLQGFLARVMLAALIEPRAVLEVYEDTTERVDRKEINAKIELTADGQFKLDADLEPVFEKDEAGNFIEVIDDENGTIASARTIIDEKQRVRRGPNYRVLSYEHFLVLPGHAREKADIWGYAKKFTKRWDVLKEAAKQHMYDVDAVDELTDSSDVNSALTPSGDNLPVAVQQGKTAEKELSEVQLLTDLDGKGLRWYVATVHVGQRKLLRLKYDDVGQGRYIIFVPYPRTDRSHEGYSFVGHKLITVTEEHTAWRNFLADHAAKLLSAPIKRLSGALWDPDDQPIGPKSVIDVRDMNEVQAMDMPDLSGAAMRREQEITGAAERVAGINDIAAGISPGQSRTLGENNMVTEQSFVRMDDVIKALLESMEELGQVRQAIWIRTLKEKGEQGMPAPDNLMADRGGDASNAEGSRVTADMLEGTFRFKPRGSTENADISRQRADYIQFLQSLAILMKTWPAMVQIIGMNLPAAKSALEQALRLFRIPDKQAWIGNEQQWQQMQPPPPMPGMPPGAPAGGAAIPPQIAAMLGQGGPPPPAGA